MLTIILATALNAVDLVPSLLSVAAWQRARTDPRVTTYCDERAERGDGRATVAAVGIIGLASPCHHPLPRPKTLRSFEDPLK